MDGAVPASNEETKMTAKNLYQVSEGDVYALSETKVFDAENSVVVLADDEADALRVARMYDRGELQIDNHVWNGQIIPAVADASVRE